MSGTVIARRGWAGVLGKAQEPSARIRDDKRDVGGRGVINHDEFGSGVGRSP
jgi:hypothetical protein